MTVSPDEIKTVSGIDDYGVRSSLRQPELDKLSEQPSSNFCRFVGDRNIALNQRREECP